MPGRAGRASPAAMQQLETTKTNAAPLVSGAALVSSK